jgi:hypothetical protein
MEGRPDGRQMACRTLKDEAKAMEFPPAPGVIHVTPRRRTMW